MCAALREGAVETLLLGDVGDSTVLLGDAPTTLAPTPEVLSELGSQRSETVRADEALPFAAVLIDADIVSLDERVAPRDGVAAILRYPRPDHQRHGIASTAPSRPTHRFPDEKVLYSGGRECSCTADNASRAEGWRWPRRGTQSRG